MKTKYSETGHQRRLSKLVRIRADLHYQLKQRAQKRGITCSKLLDDVLNLSDFWLDSEDKIFFNQCPGGFDYEMVRKKTARKMVSALTLYTMDVLTKARKKPEDYALHPNNLKPKDGEVKENTTSGVNKI